MQVGNPHGDRDDGHVWPRWTIPWTDLFLFELKHLDVGIETTRGDVSGSCQPANACTGLAPDAEVSDGVADEACPSSAMPD
jgi:hypothetical protein